MEREDAGTTGAEELPLVRTRIMSPASARGKLQRSRNHEPGRG